MSEVKRFKYSIHLSHSEVVDFDEFISESSLPSLKRFEVRSGIGCECVLYGKSGRAKAPEWAKFLDAEFRVDDDLTSSSSSAVLLFKCMGRIMAATFGHGHVLLDDSKRENDFGLIVAANWLSDQSVKSVEKANLDSIIRDAAQAAGIARLQEFNVGKALALVRKLSGGSNDGSSSMVGSSSITVNAPYSLKEISLLGEMLLKYYQSDDYKSNSFSIIDKIKPVSNTLKVRYLDKLLFDELGKDSSAFELGFPEIISQEVGSIGISGVRHRGRYADLTLSRFLEITKGLPKIEDMYKFKVVVYDLTGRNELRSWSLYKGLVGSVEDSGERYALNEGRWYKIDNAIRDEANSCFSSINKGLDASFPKFKKIVQADDKGMNVESYQREYDYNKSVCDSSNGRMILLDTDLVPVSGDGGRGLEVCDILDVHNKSIIHVKKSGRRSSVISHFLNQGMNSSKLLKTNTSFKNLFFDKLDGKVSPEVLSNLKQTFPAEWVVDFKFADSPNKAGDYTIPFFSRIALNEIRNEIEALGFNRVDVSFIGMG